MGRPEESNRKPRWFPADKAKRRLREGRAQQDGAELVRVIELAVSRLQSARATSGVDDGLKRVKFDAFEVAGVPAALQPAAVRRYIRREQPALSDTRLRSPQRLLTGKVLPLKPRS